MIVPRHPERAKEASRDVKNCGIRSILRTEVSSHTQLSPGQIECLIVNSIGELRFFYEHATVVFIGKSLTAEGGQNPIEPCAIGKPVVFGPNMQNFYDIVRSFISADAVVQVKDAAELEKEMTDLFENEKRREILGKNAKTVVFENRGAVERTVAMIVETMDRTGLYLGPRR